MIKIKRVLLVIFEFKTNKNYNNIPRSMQVSDFIYMFSQIKYFSDTC